MATGTATSTSTQTATDTATATATSTSTATATASATATPLRPDGAACNESRPVPLDVLRRRCLLQLSLRPHQPELQPAGNPGVCVDGIPAPAPVTSHRAAALVLARPTTTKARLTQCDEAEQMLTRALAIANEQGTYLFSLTVAGLRMPLLGAV